MEGWDQSILARTPHSNHLRVPEGLSAPWRPCHQNPRIHPITVCESPCPHRERVSGCLCSAGNTDPWKSEDLPNVLPIKGNHQILRTGMGWGQGDVWQLNEGEGSKGSCHLFVDRNRFTDLEMNLWLPRAKVGQGIDWELGINMYTQLYSKWITTRTYCTV